MSSGHAALALTNDDARKIIAADMHIGSKNCNYQMNQYVFKRNATGQHIIDVGKMWQKIMLTARIIAAVENPEDVCVVSSKEMGHRGIIKFAKFCGCSSTSGRFSPGTFTNHSQAGFKEPRLVIVTDPHEDHQAVREASYVNIPVIGLCDVDTPLKYIDVVIPCNNKGAKAVGLAWWLLAREVQRLRGTLSRSEDWETMPDLFFFRAPEEIKKQEEQEQAKANEAAEAAHVTDHDNTYNDNQDWAAEGAEAYQQQGIAEDWKNTGPNDWAAEGGDAAAAAAPVAAEGDAVAPAGGAADWASGKEASGW